MSSDATEPARKQRRQNADTLDKVVSAAFDTAVTALLAATDGRKPLIGAMSFLLSCVDEYQQSQHAAREKHQEEIRQARIRRKLEIWRDSLPVTSEDRVACDSLLKTMKVGPISGDLNDEASGTISFGSYIVSFDRRSCYYTQDYRGNIVDNRGNSAMVDEAADTSTWDYTVHEDCKSAEVMKRAIGSAVFYDDDEYDDRKMPPHGPLAAAAEVKTQLAVPVPTEDSAVTAPAKSVDDVMREARASHEPRLAAEFDQCVGHIKQALEQVQAASAPERFAITDGRLRALLLQAFKKQLEATISSLASREHRQKAEIAMKAWLAGGRGRNKSLLGKHLGKKPTAAQQREIPRLFELVQIRSYDSHGDDSKERRVTCMLSIGADVVLGECVQVDDLPPTVTISTPDGTFTGANEIERFSVSRDVSKFTVIAKWLMFLIMFYSDTGAAVVPPAALLGGE